MPLTVRLVSDEMSDSIPIYVVAITSDTNKICGATGILTCAWADDRTFRTALSFVCLGSSAGKTTRWKGTLAPGINSETLRPHPRTLVRSCRAPDNNFECGQGQWNCNFNLPDMFGCTLYTVTLQTVHRSLHRLSDEARGIYVFGAAQVGWIIPVRLGIARLRLNEAIYYSIQLIM